jgi:hypothetical protein
MLVPVLNYIIGVAVFHEPASLRSVLGAAIVVGSCAIVLARPKNQDHRHSRGYEEGPKRGPSDYSNRSLGYARDDRSHVQ